MELHVHASLKAVLGVGGVATMHARFGVFLSMY